jgi:hypothetical protein
MRSHLRRFSMPCFVIVIATLLVGCRRDKPPAVEKPNLPFRAYNEVQQAHEQRLKTANAEIIEQLLTAYGRGVDPAAEVQQQREAELALRAAMVRLEYWYTQGGGRDFLLRDGEQSEPADR